jgi:uncharacterized membrane protein
MTQIKQTQHRFHVVIAAVPVVILIGSFILDLFNLPTTTKEPSIAFGNVIFYLIGIGLIGLVVASLPGLADYSVLNDQEPIRTTARRHLAFSALAFLFFGGSMLCRFMWPIRVGPPLVPIALSAFGTGFLAFTCYLGYRITNPSHSSPDDDMLTYDRMTESGPSPARNTTTPPGAAVDPQWKKAEADEQRWHMEPRVDADGKSI